MAEDGCESLKELKEGDSIAPHMFSVNATPFEPGTNVSSNVHDKWQERSSVGQDQPSVTASSAPWAYPMQYYDMLMLTANMRAMTQMNAILSSGMRRYGGTPIVRPSSPGKKNINTPEGTKKVDKGSLSVHAKPWSPTPELGLDQEGDTYTKLVKGWVKVLYRGEMVVAPIAFKEIGSLFVHSLVVRPLEKPRIQLELYNYLCARCATRTFFGKLSCRAADVILRRVAGDIPPMRVAHLIEQVTGVAVCALFVEGDNLDYEVWLDKPDKAAHVVSTISGSLWTCPMFHGYAVYAKSEDDKAFLFDYITGLKNEFPEETPYPMCSVEVTAPSIGTVKG